MSKFSKDERRPEGFPYSTQESVLFQKVLASLGELNLVKAPIRFAFEFEQKQGG